MRSRPRHTGNVMYWSTPHSSMLSTVCSVCCHEMTKISGRCSPHRRRLSTESRPDANAAAPMTTTMSHVRSSSMRVSVVISAPAHSSARATVRRSAESDDMSAIRFISRRVQATLPFRKICQRRASEKKSVGKLRIRYFFVNLQAEIYVNTHTIYLNVRNSRNCRSAIQG